MDILKGPQCLRDYPSTHYLSHIILNSHIKLNPFFNKFALKKLLIEPSGQKHQFIIILTV